jgi:peptidoglycan/xylan/chitin deacetylase (PgdA/CDA1 family)/glycosyltransferase involved in cell wall biosynthesis
MNILMLLSQLEVTGAEVYAVSVAKSLIKKNHKLFIVSDTLTLECAAEFHSMPIAKRNFIQRIKNVIALVKFIKENKINVVHAHSRAAAWVGSFACKLSGIPMVVTVHGRQSTFLSRKIFKCFGDYTIAVCEEIQKQLIDEFHIPKEKMEVLRNGFEFKEKAARDCKKKHPLVSYITRLSGPKGDLAYNFLEYLQENREVWENINIRVIGGQINSDRFEKFKNDFEFTGFVHCTDKYIAESNAVIGSGRIAIESLMGGTPTIAVGEATSIGLISSKNIDFALRTNFGDMAEYEKFFDFGLLGRAISTALNSDVVNKELTERIKQEYDNQKISDRLEKIYRSLIIRKRKMEIPVIMYHRVIKNVNEAGKHGIYVTCDQFEEHMKYLRNKGFNTVSIDDVIRGTSKGYKNIIITFDDGYEDNYSNAFPILKKYGFTALIFLTAGLDFNKWDCDENEPVVKFLNQREILEMKQYGIEFGAHTLTHPNLSKLSYDEAYKEITESKKNIEKKTGDDVRVFAYPYGEANNETIDIVKNAGFFCAFATEKGPLGIHEDIFRIRRIAVFPNTFKAGFARKVKGNYNFYREKNKDKIKYINS